MYDIGENDRVLTDDIEKKKQRHKQKKQQKRNGRSFTQRIYDGYHNIKEIINMLRNKGSVNPNDMKFTGKMTDIAGVDGMKCSEVKNYMPNEEVYNATKENICKARDAGYLNIDQDGTIHLTDKGREWTQSESFIKQFEKDQKDALFADQAQNQQAAYCEFTGTQQDLGAFNYTDHIDMRTVKDSPQKDAVLNNFCNMESEGLVNIKDGIISPTEKGQELAQSQSFSVKPANAEEVNSIFSSAGKQAGEQAVSGAGQAVQGSAQTAASSGAKAVSAAGTKAVGEGVKTAAQTGVKAAATGVKTAATGATAATTGAATFGVGAVISVATESMKQVATQSMHMVQSVRNK